MKRLTAIILTLLLAITLAMPVVANELTPEDVAQMLQDAQERNDAQILELIRMLQELENQPPPPTQPPAPVHAPNPRLLSPQTITLAPGETQDITLTIRNIGTHTASNFLSQATSDGPFTVEFIGGTNAINSIPENAQRNMTLRISVNENATPGTHSITLSHLFRDHGRENLSTSDTLTVHISAEAEGTPTLEIRNMQSPMGTVGVNQSAQISFYVHNTGTGYARNIRLVSAPEDATAIVPVQTASTQTIQELAPGASQRLTFHFSPRNAARTQSYAIGFTLTHGETSFEQFASINVYNPEEEEDEDPITNLEIRNMTAPTAQVGVGGTATISFYVYNRGEETARGIEIAAEAEAGIVPVQTASTQVISALEPGEGYRLTFSFSPTAASTTRSYTVGFTVTHGGRNFRQFAAVNAFNPEPDEDEDDDRNRPTQIPRVIISQIGTYPMVPRAGQPFSMEVTFRNTSATRSVNNVRVLMEEVVGTATGGGQSHFAGFSPVSGSNTLFIDYIPPQGEVSMTLNFTTVVEAAPGAHNMRFSFDYQDQDFETHTATEAISISIAQVTRIEIDNVQIGGWGGIMVGGRVDFSYQIINSGRVNLINVRTRTEGPFDVSEAGMFIGTVNSQRTTNFNGTIIPFEAGEQRGRFIVYGEDVTGEIVELVYDFTVFVEGGMDFGDFGDMGDMGDFGMMRPGGGMDGDMMFMPQPGGFMDPETGEWIETERFNENTGEWEQLGQWNDQGVWEPFSDGFDIMDFIARPIVWGSGIALAVIAGVVVIVALNKKRVPFDESFSENGNSGGDA